VRPGDVDHVWCICVTERDYGAVATNLSLLLKKEPEDPYPWAVGASSLEAFLNALRRRRWDAAYLIKYLGERLKLHERLIGNTDELEIAGVFVFYGTLSHLIKAGAEKFIISPEYGQIFDRLWEEEQGGPPVDFKLPHKEPLYFDEQSYARQVVEQGSLDLYGEPEVRQSSRPIPSKAKRSKRNSPCPCGSGRKFKNCHGRSGD
jgi:SEC-C motif